MTCHLLIFSCLSTVDFDFLLFQCLLETFLTDFDKEDKELHVFVVLPKSFFLENALYSPFSLIFASISKLIVNFCFQHIFN